MVISDDTDLQLTVYNINRSENGCQTAVGTGYIYCKKPKGKSSAVKVIVSINEGFLFHNQ
jgi:hypothetical protein